MPRPEYFSLRVPSGTIDRIRRLSDAMGISVAEWCRRGASKYATADACNEAGSDVLQLPVSLRTRPDYHNRAAILYALAEAEGKAPRPPVIEPSEQQAAKGAVITDAMEVEE